LHVRVEQTLLKAPNISYCIAKYYSIETSLSM